MQKDSLMPSLSCAQALSKRQVALTLSCPDQNATVACNSFREVLIARDQDLMDDMGTKAHFYACFEPKTDVFFEVYFSEPEHDLWSDDAPEHMNAGRREPLTQGGSAGVIFYKNGVWNEEMSHHNMADWQFRPSRESEEGTSETSTFDGKNIHIARTKLIYVDKYKNQAGTETEHEIDLQLQTGRYVESYSDVTSGKTVEESSGRCLKIDEAMPH